MPEGPSIRLLRDECAPFIGETVLVASGNAKIDIERISGHEIVGIKTWGKHLLIDFGDFTLRVRLLLFGSYRINERRENRHARLRLVMPSGEINFYAGDVRFIEGNLDDSYDWSKDVMADAWSPRGARKTLLKKPDLPVSDVLLDQNIFAGVGNIIRNEVLFRTRIHPESQIGALPSRKLGEMIKQAREYAFDLLVWKRAGKLKKNLLIHTRKQCPRCAGIVSKTYPGKAKRRSFFCAHCQKLYRKD